jgi:hypothetical protein
LLDSLGATSLARVKRLQADAVVTRIEQVYRDVRRPSTECALVPVHRPQETRRCG